MYQLRVDNVRCSSQNADLVDSTFMSLKSYPAFTNAIMLEDLRIWFAGIDMFMIIYLCKQASDTSRWRCCKHGCATSKNFFPKRVVPQVWRKSS